MSIWASFCAFDRIPADKPEPPYFAVDDAPYADFTDGTKHYTTNDAASLASTPRGGALDVARSGICGLFRFSVEEAPPSLDGSGAEAEVWLDRRQLTVLRDALTAELERS